MRSNAFLRRLGAALSMAFLLDLGGQAAAMLCTSASAATSHATVAHSTGMRHAAAAHAPLVQMDVAPDGCRVPPGPRDCATMTTCAWPTAVASSPLTALSLVSITIEAAEPALLRSEAATAPEPPPPRG